MKRMFRTFIFNIKYYFMNKNSNLWIVDWGLVISYWVWGILYM